jgi:hypothetical protein
VYNVTLRFIGSDDAAIAAAGAQLTAAAEDGSLYTAVSDAGLDIVPGSFAVKRTRSGPPRDDSRDDDESSGKPTRNG